MIRPATTEDVGRIAELWEAMVREMRPDWNPRRDVWQEMCLQLMAQPQYVMFVAEVDGGIVGFADGLMFLEPSTGKFHGVGQHFYISHSHRKGILPGLLYREIISTSLLRGAEVLEFFCFQEELPFWRRHGYNPARVMVRSHV